MWVTIKHSNSDATFISLFKIIQSNQVHTGKQTAIEREVLWVLVTQGAVSIWRKVEELDQVSCHIDVDICTLENKTFMNSVDIYVHPSAIISQQLTIYTIAVQLNSILKLVWLWLV